MSRKMREKLGTELRIASILSYGAGNSKSQIFNFIPGPGRQANPKDFFFSVISYRVRYYYLRRAKIYFFIVIILNTLHPLNPASPFTPFSDPFHPKLYVTFSLV